MTKKEIKDLLKRVSAYLNERYKAIYAYIVKHSDNDDKLSDIEFLINNEPNFVKEIEQLNIAQQDAKAESELQDIVRDKKSAIDYLKEYLQQQELVLSEALNRTASKECSQSHDIAQKNAKLKHLNERLTNVNACLDKLDEIEPQKTVRKRARPRKNTQ